MENKKKKNKTVAILYYFASLCFYIIAIIYLVKGTDSTIGYIFLSLGSTFLCLGSFYLNKENKDNQ